MVFNEDPQLAEWILHFAQTLLEPFEHAPEAIILDEKQQFFFRLAIMIETRKADAGRARDVAHGGGVVILLGKNPRGVAQDELQLLIVFGKVLHSWERRHLACRSVRSTFVVLRNQLFLR